MAQKPYSARSIFSQKLTGRSAANEHRVIDLMCLKPYGTANRKGSPCCWAIGTANPLIPSPTPARNSRRLAKTLPGVARASLRFQLRSFLMVIWVP